jgi:ElaB/YqjD/DUF883 family membrane-anchored ribosome-binding protein
MGAIVENCVMKRSKHMARSNEASDISATDQLREKASEVGQNVRELGGQAREAAREQYDRLRGRAEEYYDRGRERAMEWEQGLEEYVQEQPIKSLLIAAGVGMLLGFFWRRR